MSKLLPLLTREGSRIAIIRGLRTPFARQATLYQHIAAHQLGSMLVHELLIRSEIPAELIEQVVFGQVVQTPETPNIARELVLGSGMSVHTDAYSVSSACTSSFQAVANLAQSIAEGSVTAGIAGGADSLSQQPIQISKILEAKLFAMEKRHSLLQRLKLLYHLRLQDLLPEPWASAEYSTGLSMGDTAEQMAKNHQISREQQDQFAHRSHTLAALAWQQGRLQQEVMSIYLPPYQACIEQDNTLRSDSGLAHYHQQPPIFDKEYGTVTAGNSSPLTDGAAALLLMSESRARQLGLAPLGYLRSMAFVAIDVWQDMLCGPAYAAPIALDRAGINLADLTLIDMHEAFAAQVLVNLQLFACPHFARQQLGRCQPLGEVDMDKFNVLGGSIAYGHPFAATGARIITQTLHELRRRGGGLGLVTACAAGGLGAAMVLEVTDA